MNPILHLQTYLPVPQSTNQINQSRETPSEKLMMHHKLRNLKLKEAKEKRNRERGVGTV